MNQQKLKRIVEGMIKPNEFVKVCTDNLKDIGITKGSMLFVTGTRPIPEDEADPYTQRVKFLVCPVEGTHVQTDKFLLVDPRNVKRVSKVMSNKLNRVLEEDFSSEEKVNEATN